MSSYTIFPVPHEVRGLEYLNLLHQHIETGNTQGDIFRIERFSWSAVFSKPKKDEHRVIHIHWETNIYGSKYVFLSLFRMIRFVGLWFLKLQGVKVVWTMHNLHAHDYPHPTIDKIGRWIMWRIANTVIIHEKNFAEEESLRHKRTPVVFIPQGNYVGVYGPLWQGDREALRKQNGIPSNEIVLIALGSVRPYKALPKLMTVVEDVYHAGVPLKLFIRGKASPEYTKFMCSLAMYNPAVILDLHYVKNEEIPKAFAIADYSVFYYGESSLNSAAMILSLSYGIPVITRDIPAAEIIKEGKNGFVFHNEADLKMIFHSLSSSPHMDRSGIIDSIKDQDWPTVTNTLKQVYRALWQA